MATQKHDSTPKAGKAPPAHLASATHPAGTTKPASDGSDAALDRTAEAGLKATGHDPRDGVPGLGRGLDEDTGTDTISGFGIGSDDK
jgi:hypothetical protein